MVGFRTFPPLRHHQRFTSLLDLWTVSLVGCPWCGRLLESVTVFIPSSVLTLRGLVGEDGKSEDKYGEWPVSGTEVHGSIRTTTSRVSTWRTRFESCLSLSSTYPRSSLPSSLPLVGRVPRGGSREGRDQRDFEVCRIRYFDRRTKMTKELTYVVFLVKRSRHIKYVFLGNSESTPGRGECFFNVP